MVPEVALARYHFQGLSRWLRFGLRAAIPGNYELGHLMQSSRVESASFTGYSKRGACSLVFLVSD